MTIKKCKWCGKEDDFVEEPTCDECAVEKYCKLYRLEIFRLIDEIESNGNINDFCEELKQKIGKIKI